MGPNGQPTYISQSELALTNRKLRRWQSPAEFSISLRGILDRMPSTQLFRQAGLAFLREAWIIYEWAVRYQCDVIRLCDDDWPDCEAKAGADHFFFEVTEVQEPGRRRGAEPWDYPTPKDDPIEAWVKRAAAIPGALRAAVTGKLNKQYSQGRCGLIIYLNVGEYGIRQREIEGAFSQPPKTRGMHFFKCGSYGSTASICCGIEVLPVREHGMRLLSIYWISEMGPA